MAVDGHKMDPRFHGDDLSFAKWSPISVILDNCKRRNTWNRYDMSQEVNEQAVPDRLPIALAVFA